MGFVLLLLRVSSVGALEGVFGLRFIDWLLGTLGGFFVSSCGIGGGFIEGISFLVMIPAVLLEVYARGSPQYFQEMHNTTYLPIIYM